MYGAILGDIIGSPYEFDMGQKIKTHPLFVPASRFTDDSVMTVAVADALMQLPYDAAPEAIRRQTVQSIRAWADHYPDEDYGIRFRLWLYADDPQPYGSFGNGAAMRVSAAGWLYDSLERVLEVAAAVTDITHNHPEGIKGAQATAGIIFLARTGHSKAAIRDWVTSYTGYDLSRTCDDIRPGYHHVESCQETVPEAITAFLEGTDFEDVIRTAVSLGGDCDTLTAIAGSMAEAFYGVPENLKAACREHLTPDLTEVLDKFTARITKRGIPAYR